MRFLSPGSYEMLSQSKRCKGKGEGWGKSGGWWVVGRGQVVVHVWEEEWGKGKAFQQVCLTVSAGQVE